MDTFGCLNNTIKVSSGHYLDLRDPQPEQIDIKSIAAALSKICRFGGHCPKFYSVAEHCILAERLALRHGFQGEALDAVFLHDAAEAFIGDMVKPLKIMVPEFQAIESRIEAAIETRFGVDFEKWQPVIKRFDRAMLKCEKLSMWPDDSEQWSGFSEIDAADVTLNFWSHERAEYNFLRIAEVRGLK